MCVRVEDVARRTRDVGQSRLHRFPEHTSLRWGGIGRVKSKIRLSLSEWIWRQDRSSGIRNLSKGFGKMDCAAVVLQRGPDPDTAAPYPSRLVVRLRLPLSNSPLEFKMPACPQTS